MKIFKSKNDNSVYINLISIFLIFVTFIGLAFITLIMELNFYNKLKVGINTTFSTGTIVSYYNNKIHNFDGNKIAILNNGKTDILMLEDPDAKLKTYVYVKDGAIYEHVTDIKEGFVYGSGTKVFEAESVKLKIKDKLVELNVKTSGDKKQKSYIYISGESMKR